MSQLMKILTFFNYQNKFSDRLIFREQKIFDIGDLVDIFF